MTVTSSQVVTNLYLLTWLVCVSCSCLNALFHLSRLGAPFTFSACEHWALLIPTQAVPGGALQTCLHLQHPGPFETPEEQEQGKSGSDTTALWPALAEQPWTCSGCIHHLPWAVLRQEWRLSSRGLEQTHVGVNLHRASKMWFLFPWQVQRSLTQTLKMLKRGAGRIVLAKTKLKYFLSAPFREPAESFFEMLP